MAETKEVKDLLVTLEDLKAVHESHVNDLGNKVDKVDRKGLSTNDYDDNAKKKVDAIPVDPKYTDTVYDDTALKNEIKAGTIKTAEWHLGFYIDENGDLCQKED